MRVISNRSLRSIISSSALFIIMLIPMVVFAQSGPTGSMSGTVIDPTGANIAGATVTGVNTQTGAVRTVVTDSNGRWIMPVMTIGVYRFTIEGKGFKKAIRENIQIEASIPRVFDTQLEVGDVTVEVQISDSPPLATPTTATTFRQLSGAELVQVPTSTRSFTHLLSAEAGVSSDLSPVLTNGTGNISPSVNGTRTTSTSLTFNGVDATNISTNEGSFSDNISPAPETLAEVKLQTSLYDASTGRSGGGNFQLITKSGGNQFHGTAYHYLQNEKFNANDFFFNRDEIERPKARRNEGGFTIGGPIVKDKLLFFGGYQYTRAQTGYVPTASSQTVLPAALRRITGERTAANIVAAFKADNPLFPLTEAQISPIALKLLNLRNPKTGDYFIPSPKAIGVGGESVGVDTTVSAFVGGNPLIRQRNVIPARFEQDQINARFDYSPTDRHRFSGVVFFANFPGFDPFPDPSSLASPVEMRRDDRNRTIALSEVYTFGPNLINEARLGYFFLNNTRSLTDEFSNITNDQFGITNPALFYDNSNATRRLGHYVFRNNLSNLSFGGPNDVYNKRKQQSFSLADNVTWLRGSTPIRIGAEYKRHIYASNLPEEQATEFEKYENFTQFLSGFAQEADTQFGITDKRFRMNDVGAYVATDLRASKRLNFNLGLRWDWFGWPEEANGRLGNFDFEALTNTENPTAQFLVPKNVTNTNFTAIDAAIATSKKADNNHTLKGQDLNNFAPRVGFAFSPKDNNRIVIRGGYGIFFDKPSAAFINTVFSNYPFLREIEVTAPSAKVPLATAYSQQNPLLPFNQYLPNRMVYQYSSSSRVGSYVIRDGTPVTKQADGTSNPTDLVTGVAALGNVAETFEFRAVDRNLRTPYVQQWNLGFQFEITRDTMIEARYTGTKGTKLLQSTAFNQGYDLNDPNTPDHIFKRFNDAYQNAYNATLARGGATAVAASFPFGALRASSTQRERGRGIAFGFRNSTTGQPLDYNLSNPGAPATPTLAATPATVIGFEARGPILGFNVPEAILLQSASNSIYHAMQLGVSRRFSRGFQYNAYYTWSKSMDYMSSDPGSTAGGGKPDVPNTGFVIQGDQRNLRSNRAVSDFDRTHRFSGSFVYELPLGKSKLRNGWQLSGFVQVQSGSPFSIFSPEPEVANASQYSASSSNLARGSGGLYRLGFGRPSLCGTLDQLKQQSGDITEGYFNTSALCSPLTAAGGYPNNLGFGNLGRNILRAPYQKRLDMGLSKTTAITESIGLEFRWDMFNLFNNVNFAQPSSDLADSTDFGTITNTIGGPRVMQFGLKLKF